MTRRDDARDPKERCDERRFGSGRDRGDRPSDATRRRVRWPTDLFALGRRRATAARRAALGDRASFVRARQLLATGAWRGPRDAAESYVEEDDLPALGGWDAARAAGRRPAGRRARCRRCTRAAVAGGARSLWRLPFRSGEDRAARGARIEALRALVARRPVARGACCPTPEGEA